MKVSVVTSCYNNLSTLRLTLPWWEMQNYDDFEVIVIDDGSPLDSGIREFVEEMELRYFRQERRYWGCDRARNVGIWNATGDLIVIVDSDCLPHPNLIREHVRVCGEDRVNCGAINHMRKYNPYEIFWMDTRFKYAGCRSDRKLMWSANMAVHRKHLIHLRGFDERYERKESRLCGEWDLACRLNVYGLKFIGVPDAQVYHLDHEGYGKLYPDMEEHDRRMNARLCILDTIPESWV